MDADVDADYDWALSPDGRTLVIRKNREAQLVFLDLSTQKLRHVAVKGWKLMVNLDWAPMQKDSSRARNRTERSATALR